MPDFGIGEAIAALSGTELFAGLFGGGEAAAAGMGAGAAAGGAMDILPAAAAFAPTEIGGIASTAGLAGAGGAMELGGMGGAMGAGGTGMALEAAGGELAGLLPTAAGMTGGSAAGVPGAGGGNALDSMAMGGLPSGGAVSPATGAVAPLPGASGGPVDLTSLVGGGNNAALPANATSTVGATTNVPGLGGATANPLAAPAGNAAGGGGGIMNSISDATGGLINSKNALGGLIGAGGLGYSLMSNKQPGGDSVKALQAQANDLASQSAAMRGYLQNGTLPPGLQASVEQAKSSAIARAISNQAQQGNPTDPTQNTALAQQIAGIEQQAITSQGQIATQLMQTGVSEAGLSEQIYAQLVAIDQTQSKQVGDAIGNFAKALGGGTSINIGK